MLLLCHNIHYLHNIHLPLRLSMALDINRIKALCFDVDGTLRDTDDAYAAKLSKMISPISWFSSNINVSQISRKIIMKVEGPANFAYSIPDRLGLDDELADISNWLHKVGILKTKRNHNYLIIPGVEETLKTLHLKFPMTVISARGKRGTEGFINTYNFSDFFIAMVSAQTAHRTKPHPAPVIWAANKMGVPPENCLMIGDTTVDIVAGKRDGAQTVGVLSGFGEKEELLEKGADLIINSVADLPSILKSN